MRADVAVVVDVVVVAVIVVVVAVIVVVVGRLICGVLSIQILVIVSLVKLRN